MAPLHGLFTKKMFVPPTMLIELEVVGPSEGVGLFKLKCWGVLQNLVPDVW